MPDYLCYLLRLRRVDSQDTKVWRVCSSVPEHSRRLPWPTW